MANSTVKAAAKKAATQAKRTPVSAQPVVARPMAPQPKTTATAARAAATNLRRTPVAPVAPPSLTPRPGAVPVPEPTPHTIPNPSGNGVLPTGTAANGEPFVDPFSTPITPPSPVQSNVRPTSAAPAAQQAANRADRMGTITAKRAAAAPLRAAQSARVLGTTPKPPNPLFQGGSPTAPPPQTNYVPRPPTGLTPPTDGPVTIQPVYPPGYQPPQRDPQHGGVNTQFPLFQSSPAETGATTPLYLPSGDSQGDMGAWTPPDDATSPSSTPGADEGSIGTALGGAGGTGGLPTNPEAVSAAAGGGGNSSAGWGGYAPTKAPPPMPSWQQWQQMTPYERAAWRTQAELAQPWAATTDQLRHSWANQGVFGAPDTTALTHSTYDKEGQTGANQTVEVFGKDPQDYWDTQGKNWQKADTPNVSQKTW